jgi:hypothetical protein
VFVRRNDEELQEGARTGAALTSDEAMQCCLKIMLVACVESDYLGGEGEAKVGRKELRTVVLWRVSEKKRTMASAAKDKDLRLGACVSLSL